MLMSVAAVLGLPAASLATLAAMLTVMSASLPSGVMVSSNVVLSAVVTPSFDALVTAMSLAAKPRSARCKHHVERDRFICIHGHRSAVDRTVGAIERDRAAVGCHTNTCCGIAGQVDRVHRDGNGTVGGGAWQCARCRPHHVGTGDGIGRHAAKGDRWLRNRLVGNDR